MDIAVALVRSYLQANGFFTVTEYPILESVGLTTRNVTDVDVLALRFPGAGGFGSDNPTGGLRIQPDPELALMEDQIEFIIGEVKEGTAELNKAARDPAVVAAALRRFGSIRPEVEAELVKKLIDTGVAFHPAGIRLRQMVFATKAPTRRRYAYLWMDIGKIAEWMRTQVHENWDQVKTIQSKDPALSFLLLFEKARRGES
ncbi:MAG: hypothetical protein BMS9Abin12_2055 [Acidimicrobiia bacterium]|nr:MAG: hypothetical protein BMS9Abin12_2055 [Acidimicrobiia bacterium]